MSGASGGLDTPQSNWYNIPDLLRTMSVKVSVKDVKISNSRTMGKRLERSKVCLCFLSYERLPQLQWTVVATKNLIQHAGNSELEIE